MTGFAENATIGRRHLDAGMQVNASGLSWLRLRTWSPSYSKCDAAHHRRVISRAQLLPLRPQHRIQSRVGPSDAKRHARTSVSDLCVSAKCEMRESLSPIGNNRLVVACGQSGRLSNRARRRCSPAPLYRGRCLVGTACALCSPPYIARPHSPASLLVE
jgi:hypothetical protein